MENVGFLKFKSGEKYNNHYDLKTWYTVAQLIEALRYKLEGRGFDSRRGHC